VRAAQPHDVQALLGLINGYAERDLLLPRSEASLLASLCDFVVAVAPTPDGEAVMGCAALVRLGPGLGEIRSLAVRADAAGQGVGHTIVRRLLGNAPERGFVEILALTRRPSFFAALGFLATRRERFPAKLLTDCGSCRRDFRCDEIAMAARIG
jgi:amino-acid N-acetyltransferase